jgi:hypothetical protein
LRHFDTQDALLFFGRDDEIEKLAQLIQANPFVTVVGASGSGKSSLVRAGSIPVLHRGRLSGGAEWRIAICRPGQDPFSELAEALPDPDPELTPTERLGFLERVTASTKCSREDWLRNSIAALGLKSVQISIVVDQFEELFTLTPDQEVRKSFVAALLTERGGG